MRLSNGMYERTVQRPGGTCRFGKGQVGIGDPVKSMAKPGTERSVVDRAPNLEQQIGAFSRPSHLLLVWTAPGGIDFARMRSLLISDKGGRPWNRLATSGWIR
jgi:hypothetical protein